MAVESLRVRDDIHDRGFGVADADVAFSFGCSQAVVYLNDSRVSLDRIAVSNSRHSGMGRENSSNATEIDQTL